ncbi:MAG: putative metal-binding motif-containing protein [Deltaproteobacteria bacterium]|nr:putative metal-binding motif-containing protein [Deltaproteobacteria bacterium]
MRVFLVASMFAACKTSTPAATQIGTRSTDAEAIAITLGLPACPVVATTDPLTVDYDVDSEGTLTLEVTHPDGTSEVLVRRAVKAGDSGRYTFDAGALPAGKNTLRAWAYGVGKISAIAHAEIDARTPSDPDAPDIDLDGDCYSLRTGDCNERNKDVHPGGEEICGDRLDNNCDGLLDYADPTCAAGCEDKDKDGSPASSCGGGDCDDDDASVSPTTAEICDNKDNNCNKKVDESFDEDDDGFVTCTGATAKSDGTACPPGFPTCSDCDDQDASTYPGAFEPCDSKVHACAGSVAQKLADNDGDGFRNCEDPDSDNDGICEPGAERFLAVTACAAANAPNGTCCGLGKNNKPDNCPLARNYDQGDRDGDGVGDACDDCSDNDQDGFGVAGVFTRNTDVTRPAGQQVLTPVGAAVGHPPGAPGADPSTFSLASCTSSSGDCNDTSSAAARAMFPGNAEVCDGLDNDCDATFDEDFDQDSDGYTTCSGAVAKKRDGSVPFPLADDCDDSPASCGAACTPDKAEVCDGKDNDCSCFGAGAIAHCVDDGFDLDLDDYTTCTGTALNGRLSRSDPAQPSRGLLAPIAQSDCQPACGAACKPGGTELCDGFDNDCNATPDDGPVDFDVDNDTYTTCGGGNPLMEDCDDAVFSVHPGGTEICDGKDNDCNGEKDDDPAFDQDDDGYTTCGSGSGCLNGPDSAPCTFSKGPVGPTSLMNVDCGPNDFTVNPGHSELCDGKDNDCDTVKDDGFDLDGDGFFNCAGAAWTASSPTCPGGAATCVDCNECLGAGCAGPSGLTGGGVRPGATETCNGVDDDCDGSRDETFDDDLDTFTRCGLGRTTGAPGGLDCDDDPATCGSACNPGTALERCDGYDNTCSNGIDEGADADNDGYTSCGSGNGCTGGAVPGPSGCTTKLAYSPTLTTPQIAARAAFKDCNDTNVQAYPGRAEICDDQDNDCALGTDDGCDQDDDNHCASTMFVKAGGASTCTATIVGPVGGSGSDCDDTTKFVHPGVADDNCDTNGALPIDNDCDGSFDEDVDLDGDGFVACPAGIVPTWRVSGAACPAGFASGCGDCNDCAGVNCVSAGLSGAAFYPGAPEKCFDGFNENCNAAVYDEDDTACCRSKEVVHMIDSRTATPTIATETFDAYPYFSQIPDGSTAYTTPPGYPNADHRAYMSLTPSTALAGWERKSFNLAVAPNTGCADSYAAANQNDLTWRIRLTTLGSLGNIPLGSQTAGTYGNGGGVVTSTFCPQTSNPSRGGDGCYVNTALVSPLVDTGSVNPALGTGDKLIVGYRRFAAHEAGVAGALHSGNNNVCDQGSSRCDQCYDGEYLNLASWQRIDRGSVHQCYMDMHFANAKGTYSGGIGGTWTPDTSNLLANCPLSATSGDIQVWRRVYADVSTLLTSRPAWVPSQTSYRFMWRYNTFDAAFTPSDGVDDDGVYIDDVSFFVCRNSQ